MRTIEPGDFLLHCRPEANAVAGPRAVARMMKALGRSHQVKVIDLMVRLPDPSPEWLNVELTEPPFAPPSPGV